MTYRPDYRLPYPSLRQPLLARNVVATSQPLAAQAGLNMLRRGGNAVDAALAAAIALTVVEPTGNGIGSDAFAIVWDGHKLHGLNASGRSPAGQSFDDFAADGAVPQRDWRAVTVPGAVSAWVELSRRFGALPFADLFEPAIAYARDGFPVSPGVAAAWETSRRVLSDKPDFAAAFLPEGRAPKAGEMWRFSEQAVTLEAIAASTGEAFYRGELAAAMVEHAKASGAHLALADLASHEPEWVGTLKTPFASADLHEIPPNGQGIAALIALGALRHTALADTEIDSAAWLHLQIEAVKLGLADAHRFVADPAHLDREPGALLANDYLAGRAARIRPGVAVDHGHGEPRRGGTVYLSAADANGMMVSYIQSNYMGFGSGVVVPRTGISLQNRGAGFVLDPGHPNRYAPGKRPFHTIIPGFLMQGTRPLASFGVMGGPMQAQGHVQMAVRMLLHAQNPQAASDAPRWQVLGGNRVMFEQGFRESVIAELRSYGHEIEVTGSADPRFGGAQLIARLEGGAYVAGSDHRKDGQAVGF